MNDPYAVLYAAWLAATVAYLASVGVLAIARHLSPPLAQRTARFWRHELWITTWTLAAPGLVAAGFGLIIIVGGIFLPLGIAVGVIATRVASEKATRWHWLPLVFVGIVDAMLLWVLTQTWPGITGAEAGTILGLVVYFALATANAARILVRGRANARGMAAATPALSGATILPSEPGRAMQFLEASPPPVEDIPDVGPPPPSR